MLSREKVPEGPSVFHEPLRCRMCCTIGICSISTGSIGSIVRLRGSIPSGGLTIQRRLTKVRPNQDRMRLYHVLKGGEGNSNKDRANRPINKKADQRDSKGQSLDNYLDLHQIEIKSEGHVFQEEWKKFSA